MSIQRCGTQPSNKVPEEYFTGNVRVDPLIQPPAPACVVAASATVEPGSRTAWHMPPLGQTLIVPICDKGHYHRWEGYPKPVLLR